MTALAFVTLNTVSASDFEGRVHMDVTSAKRKDKDKIGLDYSMKGGKVRMDAKTPDAHAGMGGIIFDTTAMEMTILIDANGHKMYMRRAIPRPDQTQDNGKAKHMSAPVKTGRTETIAGYPATEYTVTDENGRKVEMWLAKGLGSFMSFSGGNPMARGGTPPPEWESFVRDGNLFPMRVVSYNKSGKEETRMEVTSVERTSLPDSLFSTDGYQEFNMGGFGGFGH